ncbi:sigma-54-dependent Fis family transcriptional regulator [Pantoea sp. Al-1710]|uniref:Sigma-54-dependent Fis family transcriptional regulator n=2 Tax=Pantoea TaxID=53335 RepID=A0ABX0RLJ7_9GAMM|nr:MULTISPECIES: sigma 54-interacting transcriptional regulator [Pantoea]NIG12956.1 sigma-54-dependent Fis family transcriptional regulator [Pantoea sp. Cy-640]NIG17343.1 sigma-54-dependent Fis family transcriptional regulator [Pantoea communis]
MFTEENQGWLQRLSTLDIDFVIEGETGTGKDTFARTLYEMSDVTGPFIGINCAAIPDALAEAELFGTVPGAYTGAMMKPRIGHIESSHDGMLFLDEIDSMSLQLQAKFLRVLETRSVMRLGNTETHPVNLRVIAAAQRPLNELVEKGEFRSDLYFRLSTVKITLPSLREKVETIIPHFRHFAAEAAIRYNTPLPALNQCLTESLLMHRWPGNMRELKAAAMRFVLGMQVLENTRPASISWTLKDRMARIESCLIEDCLTRHDNQVMDAANELGIPARTLYNKLKSLNSLAK